MFVHLVALQKHLAQATHWSAHIHHLDEYALPMGTGTDVSVTIWQGKKELGTIRRNLGDIHVGSRWTLLSDVVSTLRTAIMVCKLSGIELSAFFLTKPRVDQEEQVSYALNASAIAERPFDRGMSDNGAELVRQRLKSLTRPNPAPWLEPITRPVSRYTAFGDPPQNLPHNVERPDTFVNVRNGYLVLPRLPPAGFMRVKNKAYSYHQSLMVGGVYPHGDQWTTPVAISSWEHDIRRATRLPGGLHLLRHAPAAGDVLWSILLDEVFVDEQDHPSMFRALENMIDEVGQTNKRAHQIIGTCQLALVAWPIHQPEGPVEARFPKVKDEMVVDPQPKQPGTSLKLETHAGSNEDEVRQERVLFVRQCDKESLDSCEVQTFTRLTFQYQPVELAERPVIASYGTTAERIGFILSELSVNQDHASFLLQTLQSEAAMTYNLVDLKWIATWESLISNLVAKHLQPEDAIPLICQLATSPKRAAQNLIDAILQLFASDRIRNNSISATTKLKYQLRDSLGTLTWTNARLACATFELDIVDPTIKPVLWVAWRMAGKRPGLFVVDRDLEMASIGEPEQINPRWETRSATRFHPEAVHHVDIYQATRRGERALVLYVWKRDDEAVNRRIWSRLCRWDVYADIHLQDILADWLPDLRLENGTLPRQKLSQARELARIFEKLTTADGPSDDQPVVMSPTAAQSSPPSSPVRPLKKRRKGSRAVLQETPPTSPRPRQGSAEMQHGMQVVDISDVEGEETEAYEDEIHEVATILESRFSKLRGRLVLQYKVRWAGCDQSEDSWTTYDDYFMAMDCLAKFQRANRHKPDLATPEKLEQMIYGDDTPADAPRAASPLPPNRDAEIADEDMNMDVDSVAEENEDMEVDNEPSRDDGEYEPPAFEPEDETYVSPIRKRRASAKRADQAGSSSSKRKGKSARK